MNRAARMTWALILMLAVPRVALAQAKQGDKEIGVGGNLFSVLSSNSTTSFGQFSLSFGVFATDRFEIGLAPGIQIEATAIPGHPGVPALKNGTTVIIAEVPALAPSTTWTNDGNFSVKAQVFLAAKSSKVKPYIGGTFVIESFKTVNGGSFADNTYTGALFGIRSYLSERTAFDFNGQFGFQTSHPGDDKLMTFGAGLTYLF